MPGGGQDAAGDRVLRWWRSHEGYRQAPDFLAETVCSHLNRLGRCKMLGPGTAVLLLPRRTEYVIHSALDLLLFEDYN